MNDNYEKLIEKFKDISKMNWIRGINSYTNSVGLTFENILGKNPDSMYFPDYQGIEIKCTQRFSRYPITLFSCAFDGPSFYEMNEILNKYGKKDDTYTDKKILMANLSCNKKALIYDKYYFKLDISKKEQKVYLSVYDINNNLIQRNSFIKFETLKQRLQIKLNNLALVWASKRNIDAVPYFRYYKIVIYKLISFERFIELLNDDIVKVSIIGRISRSGLEVSRQRNKNLVFQINKDNILKLFNILDAYDNDLNSRFQIL